MSVFLRNVILDIYTYLCNIFAYFENFMRYIIYKIHILYNNVRSARMYANVRRCARAYLRPPATMNLLICFFNKSGKILRFAQ